MLNQIYSFQKDKNNYLTVCQDRHVKQNYICFITIDGIDKSPIKIYIAKNSKICIDDKIQEILKQYNLERA